MLIALLLIAHALAAYYFWRRARAEADGLWLTRHTVVSDRLPAAFDGFKILHLSDLHFRGPSPRGWLMLRAAEQAAPDIIVITGDLVGGHRGLLEASGLLRCLARRWPTYVVLGNADLRTARADALAASWSALGARVLVNQGAPVERRGEQIWLAGVNDSHTGRDFLESALAGAGERDFVIALSHSPDLALRPEAAAVDLILAGHTHGGQIVLPRIGPLYARCRLGLRYASGLRRLDGTQIFVSRGAGSSRLQLRLHCPPEAAVVTLTRAA
jgi:predicted MPP superfamily phosphohydrolase